jgi:hypothetical protein
VGTARGRSSCCLPARVIGFNRPDATARSAP